MFIDESYDYLCWQTKAGGFVSSVKFTTATSWEFLYREVLREHNYQYTAVTLACQLFYMPKNEGFLLVVANFITVSHLSVRHQTIEIIHLSLMRQQLWKY